VFDAYKAMSEIKISDALQNTHKELQNNGPCVLHFLGGFDGKQHVQAHRKNAEPKNQGFS
jgi:hypothetical protein